MANRFVLLSAPVSLVSFSVCAPQTRRRITSFCRIMSATSLLLLLFSLPTITLAGEEDLIVKLENGDVEGKYVKSVKGTTFVAFLGIPYAEPPEGELRFKPPVAKKPWKEEGVLRATEDAPFCAQKDLLSESIVGREDCLYLNVYAPESTKSNLPVMVWFYGGAFEQGHAASWMYGPGYLLDSEIVLVTFNYRLNILGFLSTGDEASPGNYGLLDQIEALKWVKANIHAFGGDPDKVTLFGQSAGSVAITYHLYSPLSKDLFHQVIAMSGTAASKWAYSEDPLSHAKIVAQKLNCPIDENVQLVDCLRKKPANEIVSLVTRKEYGSVAFVPTKDGYFLPDNIHNLFSSKKIQNRVPVLIGITKDEGVGIYSITHRGIKPYTEDLLKLTIDISMNKQIKINDRVIGLIKEKYLNKVDTNDKVASAKALSKIMSDFTFEIPNYQTVQYLIEAGVKIYAYSYDYVSSTSIGTLLGVRPPLGAGHCDDMLLLFDGRIFNMIPKNDATKQIQKKLITMWTDFAKYGNPTLYLDVIWPESSSSDEIYVYHIAETNSVGKYDINKDTRFDFWLNQIPRAANQSEKEEL